MAGDSDRQFNRPDGYSDNAGSSSGRPRRSARSRHFPRLDDHQGEESAEISNPVVRAMPEHIQQLLHRNQEMPEPWEQPETQGTTNPMPEHIQRIQQRLETLEPSWEQLETEGTTNPMPDIQRIRQHIDTPEQPWEPLETEQQNQMWQRWQNVAQELNMDPPNPTQWQNYLSSNPFDRINDQMDLNLQGQLILSDIILNETGTRIAPEIRVTDRYKELMTIVLKDYHAFNDEINS